MARAAALAATVGLVVSAAALAVLVATLATEDDAIVLRWPAYAGIALAALLVAAAAARLPSRA